MSVAPCFRKRRARQAGFGCIPMMTLRG